MTSPDFILHSIADAIDATIEMAEPAGVLVGLSGGPDSVLLLEAAVVRRDRQDAPVEAAHLHHGLRGAEADADLEFCRVLCADKGVPFHSDVAMGDSTAGEAHLRHIRQSYLLSVLQRRSELSVCATGHHADDQVETVLMRLFRGAGLDGLTGIRPRSGSFSHPMLTLDRETILRTLADLGRDYRVDASNLHGNNLRARMRRDLLPVLDDLFGPGGRRGPARSAELLRLDVEALDRAVDGLRSKWRDDGLAECDFPVTGLIDLPPALAARAIRRVVTQGGTQRSALEASHIETLRTWLGSARSGSRLELPEGWTAEREFEILKIRPVRAKEPSTPHLRLTVSEARTEDLTDPAPEEGWSPPVQRWNLTLPQDVLVGPPRIRPWRPGDRMQPFGLPGHKKVSDLLREARVPTRDRRSIMLVEDDNGPFWLVGIMRDERTRLLPTATRGLTLLVDSLTRDIDPGDV